MKNILCVFSFLFSCYHVGAQQPYTWANDIGGTGGDNAYGLAVDRWGNVCVGGAFQGTVDFDPGPGISTHTAASTNGYVARYDNDGNVKWSSAISGTGSSQVRSMACDDTGNIYVGGTFSGTADFGTGTGAATLTSLGLNDAFMAKYDSAGNCLWAGSIGSATQDDMCAMLAVDKDGNIYTAGMISLYPIDFDPGPGQALITGDSNSHVYLAKYDNNGNYLWAETIGNDADQTVLAVSLILDSLGDVLLIGQHSGNADFDPGPGVAVLPMNGGLRDPWFAKYDADGAFIYAKSMSSSTLVNSNKPYGITTDRENNIYVVGNFSGTMDFDPGPGVAELTALQATGLDMFVTKYDTDGNYLWAKFIPGGGLQQARNVCADTFGNVYVSGEFSDTIRFDPGPDEYIIGSKGWFDIFMATYSSTGVFLNAQAIGDTGSERCVAMVLDIAYNTYIAGYFHSPVVDFDPGTGVANQTNAGDNDLYFAKYGNAPIPQEPNSMNAVAAANGLSVYPNPFSNTISVESDALIEEITVTDMTGKLIYRTTVNTKHIMWQCDEHLATGVYLLRVQCAGKENMMKIMKW